MLKRIFGIGEDGDEERFSQSHLGGDHLEIVMAKLTTTKAFPPKAWIALTYMGKDILTESPRHNSNIQTPVVDENCENHRWWVFRGNYR